MIHFWRPLQVHIQITLIYLRFILAHNSPVKSVGIHNLFRIRLYRFYIYKYVRVYGVCVVLCTYIGNGNG